MEWDYHAVSNSMRKRKANDGIAAKQELELIYLLRLEPLLLTLLLRLLLRLEAGDPFLGDGDLSSFPFGDRSGLPFTTSRSGLDILVSATSPSNPVPG